MTSRYHKLFVGSSVALQALPFSAVEIWCRLHMHEVEADGTVAHLKPDEKPADAVIRALAVPPRQRPRYRREVPELIDHGFLVVDPDRVRLANWRERQGWRKGKVPSPQQTPRSSVTQLHVVNGSNGTLEPDTSPDETWDWDEEGPLF